MYLNNSEKKNKFLKRIIRKVFINNKKILIKI